MNNPILTLCIPGPWQDRKDLLVRIVQETKGDIMFAGTILAQAAKKRHAEFDFCEPDPDLERAFQISGQGRLSAPILAEIGGHGAVVYLRFTDSFIAEREKIVEFCRALRSAGGIAVKVESAGISFGWDEWFERIESDNPFNWYKSLVVLVGDRSHFYSCGMHHFLQPDVEVTRAMDPGDAADLMNRFNYWRIVDEPKLDSGHTFSVAPDSPHFRLSRIEDSRHEEDHLFHNPQGLWRLEVT